MAIKVIHKDLKVISWVSCVRPSTYLKRVIVTPVVYPRLVDDVLLICYFTSSNVLLKECWAMMFGYLSTKFWCWFNSFVTSPQETFCNKENWNILLIQVIYAPSSRSCDVLLIWYFTSTNVLHKENWNSLLIQVIYAHSSQWCDGPAAHLLLHLKKCFAIRKTEISC